MSDAAPTHPEDIKAALRKRFRSLANFEREQGLPRRSATDVLIGRRRPAAANSIAQALGHSVTSIFPGQYESATAEDSAGGPAAHSAKPRKR